MTVYTSAFALHGVDPCRPAGFHIVHVCIANQCRSPMAERISRRELHRRLGPAATGWQVTSAGNKAKEGTPMHKCAVHALTTVGADPAGFQSRQITERIVGEADLILAATITERDKVISKSPRALRTAFTLKEFARLVAALPPDAPLASGDPATRARSVVTEARKLRGRIPYVDPSADDVEDPPRNPAAFERCAAEITRALDTILDALIGTPATSDTAGGCPQPATVTA